MYEIVIGRSQKDKETLHTKGSIFLGRHYVTMGQTTSLSNDIFMDVSRSHIVFIAGKRGSGKSYTMGVMAEGMSSLPQEISQNISVIILDTMGIYWTMKYANKKDELLLKKWGLHSTALNVDVYTPTGYYNQYKERGIPTDFPFSIKPSELAPSDWALTFGIDKMSPAGILIERVLHNLQELGDYSIEDIITAIRQDEKSPQETKDAAENLFTASLNWGLFSDKGTSIRELVSGGKVTIIDVSCYTTIPGASGIRALVIGLIAEKLFIERMIARKNEESQSINAALHYFREEDKLKKLKLPMVWLIIDEAHEFLPNKGKTTATDSLITILREGREPGISLILATQQPGKIHTDVITQSDIVIAHRLTAKLDVDSLGMLTQSYMQST